MAVIRPNIGKVLLMNLMKSASMVLLLIVILLVLEFTVGLDIFIDILEPIGLVLEASVLLQWAIVAVIVLAFVYIAYTYFSIMNVKFELFEDRLKFSRTVFLIFKGTREISYSKITRVTYDSNGFFDKIFSTGSVVLDLSAAGEKEVRMEYLEKPTEVAEQIQAAIRSVNLKAQAQYTAKHRIDDLLDKGGL